MWESHSICVWAVAVLTFGVILGIFMELQREEEPGRHDCPTPEPPPEKRYVGLLLFIVEVFIVALLIFLGAFLFFVLAGMLP